MESSIASIASSPRSRCNWAGKLLDSYHKILNYAGTTRTQTGFSVHRLSCRRHYPCGLKPRRIKLLLFDAASLINRDLIYLILPSEYHRSCIHFLEVQVDSLDEFLFALHLDLPEHAARHPAEHILHQIERGAVLGNEDETESVAVRLTR